jgi:hypothetical protein
MEMQKFAELTPVHLFRRFQNSMQGAMIAGPLALNVVTLGTGRIVDEFKTSHYRFTAFRTAIENADSISLV